MNNLGRVNDTLHEQLERLNEMDVNDISLPKEIARSKALGDITKDIVKNASLVLEAKKFKDNRMDADIETKMLDDNHG